MLAELVKARTIACLARTGMRGGMHSLELADRHMRVDRRRAELRAKEERAELPVTLNRFGNARGAMTN